MARDERMQRGLAVQRRMQQHQPNFERGLSSLAERYPRGIPRSDAQAYLSVRARYGVEAATQWLRDSAGFTADEAFAAGTLDHRGGPDAIGQAIQAEAVAQAQATAAQDAVAALEKLQPAQWNAAAQILAQGGPEALAREAVRLGMSREAAAVAARHLATNGVEATRQAVAENVKATARADALHALAERDVKAAKPGDPFGRVDVAQSTLDYYVQHEASLARAGLGAKPGEGPTAWLRRVASGPGAAEKLAAATGGDAATAKTIVRAAALHERTRESNEIAEKAVARLAERDGNHPKPEAKAPPRNELRETIKAAAKEHGGLGKQRVAVGNGLQATIAMAAGHEPKDMDTTGTSADRDIQRTADRMERPEPVTLRSTIEAAIAQHDEETDNG